MTLASSRFVVPCLAALLASCASVPEPTPPAARAPAAQALVLRQAELMARPPNLTVLGEVRVWNMRRDAHSRTNLVEFSGRSPLHSHPDADHTLLVVQGAITVRAGSQEVRLQAGDYICIPPHMPHAYWVDPGTKALLVSFDAPAYDEKKTVWMEPRGR
jgi:quercetin dioxygenase-like cupin family protein